MVNCDRDAAHEFGATANAISSNEILVATQMDGVLTAQCVAAVAESPELSRADDTLASQQGLYRAGRNSFD
jgi:hypothetical protein